MDSIYRKYYTSEILEKIKKFGFKGECSRHIIDLKEGEDLLFAIDVTGAAWAATNIPDSVPKWLKEYL